MEKLIREIFDLKTKYKELENQENKIKEEKKSLEGRIEEQEKLLLDKMKENNSKEIDLGEVVATVFSRENIGYTSDKDVLEYLKKNNFNDLITTKITEAINKINLKKALKINAALAEALKNMTIKTTTEYVVVTNKENHIKMLEHINTKKDV